MDLGVVCDLGFKAVQTPNVTANIEDVNVLAYFAGFIKNAVAQSRPFTPERIQSVANGPVSVGKRKFSSSSAKGLQMAAQNY